jgi:SAM-dependent methyltransferase
MKKRDQAVTELDNSTSADQHAAEIAEGLRFKFGENWQRFLSLVGEDRIVRAESALAAVIGRSHREGDRFLDIGSGSGLSSLAARRAGLDVVSFDYDPASVACTMEMKRRFSPTDSRWQILRGSALDEQFLESLGVFSVVYSWGVLHHTGEMWKAIDLATRRVADDGLLVLAIYNDQGPWSRAWKVLKRIYNILPGWLRKPYALLVMLPREARIAAVPFLKFKPAAYFALWTAVGGDGARGMSRWYDLVDWIGGYPFEVAKPEQIFEFCRQRGFELEYLSTCGGGLGCNEFAFRRRTSHSGEKGK